MNDDYEYLDEPCPKCNGRVVQGLCYQIGCEDGYIYPYEDCPLWYDPDDFIVCGECGGHGFMKWCKDCGYDFHTAVDSEEII